MRERRLSQPSLAPGFTLLELMIATAVAAILALVAFQSYRGYVLRTNRALVRAVMVDIAAKLEVEALKTRTYPSTFDFYLDDGDGAGALMGKQEIGVNQQGMFLPQGEAPGSLYSIRIESADGRSFELTATPKNTQVEDAHCAELKLKSTGLKSALPAGNAADCWSR